jgi:hypothetical protein
MTWLARIEARPAHSIGWKACVSLACLLLPIVPAVAGERDKAAGAALCAEREALLQTLVEAHGRVPNAASTLLQEMAITIGRARAACDDDQAGAAIYDSLIARLVSSAGLASSAGHREEASATGHGR